jgi:glyoxylase-like metal-dependent hydrolase (beta-lactamase superfamily II)
MSDLVLVKQVLVGSYEVFTYIVACRETMAAVVIDPAGEEDRLAALIQEEGYRVKYILSTHGHADHVLASERLRDLFGVPTCMHEADVAFFSDEAVKEKMSKELGLSFYAPVDMHLKGGDVLDVGRLRIEVLHTPGHTPGSVCFLTEGNLFTGDTLFVGAAGRTDLTGASLETLIESIREKLLSLPKDTVVWPGHDYGDTPASTIGREMEENIYITDFILDA